MYEVGVTVLRTTTVSRTPHYSYIRGETAVMRHQQSGMYIAAPAWSNRGVSSANNVKSPNTAKRLHTSTHLRLKPSNTIMCHAYMIFIFNLDFAGLLFVASRRLPNSNTQRRSSPPEGNTRTVYCCFRRRRLMGQTASACCTSCCPCPSWRRRRAAALKEASAGGGDAKSRLLPSECRHNKKPHKAKRQHSRALRRPPPHLRESVGDM